MKNKEIIKSKKMLHNEHVGKNKYGTLEIKQANFAILNLLVIIKLISRICCMKKKVYTF